MKGAWTAVRSVEIDFGTAHVLVLPSVKGLVKEGPEVAAAFEAFDPTALTLPIGTRELEEILETLLDKGDLGGRPGAAPRADLKKRTGPTGLKDEKLEYDPDATDYEDFGLFVSNSDMVFLRRLSKFGDVEMPPPSYQEAVRLARAKNLPVEAVDLDDDAYTDVFIQHVSAFSLVRHGRRLRKLARRKFKATDAEGLTLEWDKLATKTPGYLMVERAREHKMAAGIAALTEGHKRVLAIVELERSAGVLAKLREMAAARTRAAAAASPEGSPSHA